MNSTETKKAAKRKRQRIKHKQHKSINNSTQEEEIPQSPEEILIETDMEKTPENKSKEEILADRKAKKAAKQGTKGRASDLATSTPKKPIENVAPGNTSLTKEESSPIKSQSPSSAMPVEKMGKLQDADESRDEVVSARAARKSMKQEKKRVNIDESQSLKPSDELPKQTTEKSDSHPKIQKRNSDVELAIKMENMHLSDQSQETPGKMKVVTKAERRAIQEAQRAAKAKILEEKKTSVKKTPGKFIENSIKTPAKLPRPDESILASRKVTPSSGTSAHKVKLFKHLYVDKCDLNLNANQQHLHPAIIKLGLQFANDLVVGSNARCYAFLNAMKSFINDYETPEAKIFSRGLEAEIQPAMDFLQKCRPFAVSMTNALKYIKLLISQEKSNDNDDDIKRRLIDKIETYAREQIEMAAIAISLKVREKISNGDVILTYGCSSLIKRTLVEAWKESELKFRVIVVDSRPDHEGQEMLKSLTMQGINCTYVLINAVSFVMPEVTKVLLGAHALLANGYVMSRVGTAQIAMIANSYNVPVLICCETHKFSERVQTDSFVFNELGDPNALIKNKNSQQDSEYLKNWETIPHLTPLNLRYDITPPELVTAVVTEIAILPCTSVQVILRVKPSE